MQIKINREIKDFTEAIFFGLSLRQFFFSMIALGMAVGIYFTLRPYLGTETLSWLCMLAAAPFAAMGFIKYNGMTAERLLLTWLKSTFLLPNVLLFKASNLYYDASRHRIKGGS